MLVKSTGFLNRRAFVSSISGLKLRDVPVPELPTQKWVRLRTVLGGICGTDLATIQLRQHPASFLPRLSDMPFGMGHECVAEIETVGADVRGFKPGDRVVVEPSLCCAVREIDPPCRACAEGTFSVCEYTDRGTIPPGIMLGYNSFTGGTWGPTFVAHQWQLHRVPESVPDEHAVLVDPLACSLHGVLRHKPADKDRVLVQGGGIIGLGAIAALRALECKCEIAALVRPGFQEDLARTLGADHVITASSAESAESRYDRIAEFVGGRRVAGRFGSHALFGGFDVVYNCIGSGNALTDAAKFTRARGTLVLLGTGTIAIVDTTPFWFTELNVVGSNGRQIEDYNGRELHTYAVLFDLMARKKLDPAAFPTRTFPLADFRRAIRELTVSRNEPLIRALLRP